MDAASPWRDRCIVLSECSLILMAVRVIFIMIDMVVVTYKPSCSETKMMDITSLFCFGKSSESLFDNLGKQVVAVPFSSLCLTCSKICLVNVTTWLFCLTFSAMTVLPSNFRRASLWIMWEAIFDCWLAISAVMDGLMIASWWVVCLGWIGRLGLMVWTGSGDNECRSSSIFDIMSSITVLSARIVCCSVGFWWMMAAVLCYSAKRSLSRREIFSMRTTVHLRDYCCWWKEWELYFNWWLSWEGQG